MASIGLKLDSLDKILENRHDDLTKENQAARVIQRFFFTRVQLPKVVRAGRIWIWQKAKSHLCVFQIRERIDLRWVALELQKWKRFSEELEEERDDLSDAFYDQRCVLFDLCSKINQPLHHRILIAVKDRQGNLQAAAICRYLRKDRDFEIEDLAAAPWNMPKIIDDRRVSGAGTALMEEIFFQSCYCDPKGRIVLDSLSGAKDFYQKMGFVPNPERRAGDRIIPLMCQNSYMLQFLRSRGGSAFPGKLSHTGID